MSDTTNILDGLGDIFINRGVGAMIQTPRSLQAVDSFAANDASVVVADVEDGHVCQAISDALEAKDGRACLLMDLAERMADKFLVLRGVDPLDETTLETIKIITAQADCPVVVLLLPATSYVSVCATLYMRQLQRRRKLGGAR